MPTKNELLQFVVTNNTNDCSIDVPLLTDISPTVNSRTRYTWDITGQNIGCGCWEIVINGQSFLNTYDGTLLGLQQGFTNLGYGFFCTTTQGGSTFLYTLDDVNIYGQIDSCVCPVNTATLYYPIVGSIVGWDTPSDACNTGSSAPYSVQVFWYGNLTTGTKLYLNTSGTSVLVVDTTKYYFINNNWCSIDSDSKIDGISSCGVPTTTTTTTTTSTTTTTTTAAPTTTSTTTTTTTGTGPTTTTTTTTSTTTTTTTLPPTTTTTTSTTTTTTTPAQILRYGTTVDQVCTGGGSSILSLTYIGGSTICDASQITASEFFTLPSGNYVIYDSYNGWVNYNKPNGTGTNNMFRLGIGCNTCPTPTTTSTTSTTTTLPPFSANIATTNAYDACNAPELTNLVFYGNGLNACDSTSVVISATLAAYLGDSQPFYINDRVDGVFYSSEWTRVGTTLVANRNTACVECVPPSTTTTTTTSTTTTTTTLPPFEANIATTNAYDACNAPELTNLTFFGNGTDACNSTSVTISSTLAAYLGDSQPFYINDRVGGIFYSSGWTRVGTTLIANKDTACVECVPPTTTTTTTTSTTTTTTTLAPTTTTTTSTTTTTTTLPPVSVTATPSCDGGGFPGQGRVTASSFSGGTGSYTFAAIGTSEANAIACVNNPSCPDRVSIVGLTTYAWTSLANNNYAVAIKDTANNLGFSSLVVVSCNATTTTTSTTTTTTTLPPPTTTTTSTTTTTTTLPPVSVTATPSCDGGGFPGQGRVTASSFSGGTGSYTFAAIGTSEANAIACVNNPSCPDRVSIVGLTTYAWTSLANSNYAVAIRDTAGNIGFSSLVLVSCNATTTTTSTTTTTTTLPPTTTTTTTSTTTTTTTAAPLYNYYEFTACSTGVAILRRSLTSYGLGEIYTFQAGPARRECYTITSINATENTNDIISIFGPWSGCAASQCFLT